MSIPLGNQHLSLFGVRPLVAQDLTADQRNIFQRPITVAAEGVTEVAEGRSSDGASGESAAEWLRRAETYRSSAKAGQQAEAVQVEPVQDGTQSAPVQAVAAEPEDYAPTAPEPIAAPTAPQPQPAPASPTPPRWGWLGRLFGG